MSTRRGGARGQPRAESPSSSGFGWKEVVLCVVGAVPLAILYRHFLIPTLAGLGTVRWLKSLSLDDVAHGAGSMIGWSAKDVDSWASRTGHKMDGVLLFLGRQNPWVLGIAGLFILIAIAACDDCCLPKRRTGLPQDDDDMSPELKKEFASIEKELEELEAELDTMEVEWAKDHPEEAAKLRAEREQRTKEAGGRWPRKPRPNVSPRASSVHAPSRFYRKPRGKKKQATGTTQPQPARTKTGVRRRKVNKSASSSTDKE